MAVSNLGPIVFRSRYAICDDCECVTIVERNDPRGVPDEEFWEECTVDDDYWARGKAAGHASAVRIIEAALGANDVVHIGALRAALDALTSEMTP